MMIERRNSILESLKGLEKDVKDVQECLSTCEFTATVRKGRLISEELIVLLNVYIPFIESSLESNGEIDEARVRDFELKCFELCQVYLTVKMELYRSNHLK